MQPPHASAWPRPNCSPNSPSPAPSATKPRTSATGSTVPANSGPSALPPSGACLKAAGVEVQKALQEQEVIAYRQTVLGALQEVENALVASVKEQSHRESLSQAVAANRKAVTLAEKLYTEGLTDFINVLQAQQALFSTENALVQSTASVSTNLVALYKALGGGWSEPSEF